MARNPRIIKSRIFLFLGAGASEPFGGWLMNDFMYNLKSRLRKRDDLVGLLETLMGDTKKADLETVLKELDEISDKPYFADTSNINYINDILDSELDRDERDKDRDKARAFGGVSGFQAKSEFSKRYVKLSHTCKELRMEIEKLIFDHYGSLEHSLVVQIYKPLFDNLFYFLGKEKILPVFTTNYDRVIEEYRKSLFEKFYLTDGFKELTPESGDRIWDRNVFDRFQPKEDKANIILFKLHGSICWYESNNQIRYFDIPIHQVGNGRAKNVLIYPAKTKIALTDPYFTAYDYFQRCLDNAEFGIFIGYSFRDYDTVTKIKSSLNLNEKLRLIILDPWAEQLITTIFRDFEKRFIGVNYYFGRKGQIGKYLDEIKDILWK